MPLILLDTNLLVYAFDQNEPVRQQQALRVLQALELVGNGRLSVQCLSEFGTVVIRRLRPALTPNEAIRQIDNFLRAFPVFPMTPMIVMEAMRGVRDYQFAYYDAQIWATAHLNQIPVIFSEDTHTGVFDGVRFINPFAPDFVLETWATYRESR